MVYVSFMPENFKGNNLIRFQRKSLGIMVNLNNPDRYEFNSRESAEIKHLNMFPNREQNVRRDLNEQLLSFLKENVSGDKVNHIQELLKKGADPNTIDSSGNRPIHLAIMNSPRNVDLVLEIINFGAELNVINNYGSTPLTFSLQKKCHKTTEILIKRRIDLNFQCQRGWTALMIASMVGDVCCVRTLLEHGADVNKFDCNRKTALMFAVEGNYGKIIKELLDYGANFAMSDTGLRTAFVMYLKKPYPDLDVINEFLLHCASYLSIEYINQASFSKIMNICLKRGPPYHACVGTIIKIQMLVTSGDHRCVEEFEDWYDFAKSCCSEIRFMERASSCYTATLLRSAVYGSLPKDSELEKLLPFVANKNFPIYSEILMAQLRKPFLKEKFMHMLIYAKKEGHANEIVHLNSDINAKLKSYLSDDDVRNFVLAAYVNINSRGRISDRSLYPQGRSYNFKDLTCS